LYKLARLGEEVDRAPRQITIHTLSLDLYQLPFVTFTVRCSRGTYVRTLASDIGTSLGCGAHLVELRRTKSGTFTEDLLITLHMLENKLNEGHLSDVLISPLQALSHLPNVTLTEEGVKNVGFGRAPAQNDLESVPGDEFCEGQILCLVRNNKLQAIGSCNLSNSPDKEKTIRLLRVFS
jgi:tRNA pseudouridine55 synthase